MEKVTTLRGDEEDGDLEADEVGRDLEAWEREYADDRSWEALIEDESGLLKSADTVQQQRQRRRRIHDATAPRIQRGIIRYLYVLVDFSRAAGEMDFRPSRMAVVANCVEAFVREYFDQNPLSHLGIILMKNGVSEVLTELSGSPESHIRALRANLETSGDASIQNGVDRAYTFLSQIPTYGHREILLVFSALSTCDPGDIMQSMKLLNEANIRCSVIGLSAEIFICKLLCEKTGGNYSVALNEGHLKELLMDYVPPPPAQAKAAALAASLVRMGFPQRGAEEAIAICACHREVKVGGGYTCPRCRARICELPTECNICGLTLVSSPHLARSYHHLFPIPSFDELILDPSLKAKSSTFSSTCFACRCQLSPPAGSKEGVVRLRCPRCRKDFCLDCDLYIHENLHNCPGCETLPAISAPDPAPDDDDNDVD